ncbi:MAG: ferredoxin [Candidatus Nanoarchaeia archaeon]
MTVKVDKETCIGCALCASIAEDVFEMKDDSKSYVKKQRKGEDIKEAIESCPVDAISDN